MNKTKQKPPRLNTKSHNEVLSWLERQESAGAIKHCMNLTINKVYASPPYTPANDFFIPQCSCRSFDWGVDPPLTQETEEELLILFLANHPARCPGKCHNYRSRRIHRLKMFVIKPIKSLVKTVKGAVDYFFKTVDMPTRLFIIALLLVIFAPRLANSVIQVMNAFHMGR